MRVQNRQSLFDIALLVFGDSSFAWELAIHNNISITATLEVNTVLNIPEKLINENNVTRYYKNKMVVPATALDQKDLQIVIGKEGIGYWNIKSNFKVS